MPRTSPRTSHKSLFFQHYIAQKISPSSSPHESLLLNPRDDDIVRGNMTTRKTLMLFPYLPRDKHGKRSQGFARSVLVGGETGPPIFDTRNIGLRVRGDVLKATPIEDSHPHTLGVAAFKEEVCRRLLD